MALTRDMDRWLLCLAWALAGCETGQLFGTEMRRKSYSWERDSDRDGISDRQEVASRLDPYDAADAELDQDDDGLSNYWEVRLGFDPHAADSGKGRQIKNGIRDGDEDLNGDDVPIGWEIAQGIDPLGADNRLADSDRDGYSNAEEFAHNSLARDPASHPGDPEGLLVYGAILGRTNSIFVRVTANWCGVGEWALVTGSSGHPSAEDARWVPCSTAEHALAGMLASTVEGAQAVYLWRRNAYGIIEHPIVGSVVYDVTPPRGSLEATAASRLAIVLTHTPPAADDYHAVTLTRFAGERCQGDGARLALAVKDLRVTDGDLPFGFYCYEISWTDTVGNVAKQQLVWPDPADQIGPQGGSLGVLSIDAAGHLTLAVTPPQDPDLASLTLRRYPGQGCASAAETDGEAVSAELLARSVSDQIPSRLAPYCYQAFWRDLRGNLTTTTVTYPDPSDTTPPAGGRLVISELITQGIRLQIEHPTDVDYARLALRRYEAQTCAEQAVTEGSEISVSISTTEIIDQGLSLAVPYCYKVFWYDTNNNLASATAVYGGIVGTGTVAINGFGSYGTSGSRSIELAHTPPDSEDYARLEIDRYENLNCSGAAAGRLTPTLNAASITDSGLKLGTPYCYKAYWFDAFGNQSSALVPPTYAGTGPPGGAIVMTSRTANSLTLTHTKPSAEHYAAVKLRGMQTSLCDDIGTANEGYAIPLTPDQTSVSSSGLVPSLDYCFKIFWYDTFGNFTTAQLTDSPKILEYFVPSVVSLAAPTPSAITMSEISVSARLDLDDSGTNVTLKPLLGDADTVLATPTTSNGAASTEASDIPGLVYADANCEALSQPKLCVRQSTYDPASRTAQGGFDLVWNYSRFDQGRYDLVTMPYVNFDGTKLYAEAQTTTVTVNNPEELAAVHQGSAIGESRFFDSTTWANHRPSLALSDKLLTSQSQVYGIIFPAFHERANQFIGVVRLDHEQDTTYTRISDSDPSYQLSVNAETESMSVASIDAGAAEFLVASVLVTVSGGRDLVLRRVALEPNPDDPNNPQNFEAYKPSVGPPINVSNIPDDTFIQHVALTPVFSDVSGILRHGMVFFGMTQSQIDPAVYESDVFVSKIRSRPNSISKLGYFDADGFYNTASNPIKTYVPSVPVTATNLNTASVSMLRIVHSYEDPHDYFYLGWRNEQVGAIAFARMQADLDTSPSAILTKINHEILKASPTEDDSAGRPAYELAVGHDSQGNRLLGVLFVENSSGDGQCKFRAYKLGDAQLEQATSSDLPVGNSTNCRFPSLFWNSISKRFMAVWIDGPSGATLFAEFKVDLTNAAMSALIPSSLTTIEITRPRGGGKKVCNFVASYSPIQNETMLRQIAALSIETVNCAQNNVGGEMHIDVYRPGR